MAALMIRVGMLPALTLIITLALQGQPAEAAALDDRGLSAITASSAAAMRPGNPASGLVVEGTLDNKQQQQVTLENGAQSDVRAMNLLNVSGADSIQALNFYHSGRDSPPLDARLSQENRLFQTTGNLARLAHFEAGAPVTEKISRVVFNAGSTSNIHESMTQFDQRVSSEIITTRLDATVTPRRIGFFDEPVSLGVSPVSLPDFTIGGSWEVLGYDLPLPATLTVSGAEFFPGNVTLEGSDVKFSGPRLSIPDVTFTACLIPPCGEGDGVQVTLTGATVQLDDIILEGVNPAGDLGVELGYAIAGDGSIAFDSGGIEFSGAIPLDLGTLADFTFGILLPELGDVGSAINSLDLPGFEIPVDESIDFPEPDGFNRQIGAGETCQFSQTQNQCAPIDTTTTRVEYNNHSITQTREHQSASNESLLTYDVKRERGELRLRTRQSRVTVIRQSSARERRYNLVVIRGQSQRGARVINGVNAASALVGNGLNVTAISTTHQGTAMPLHRMNQQNQFTQIGGL
ncbi:hypothetical protein NLU14_12340 [Marinobacter sp. 71-i]|uniref:Uncharacterized protein n=1 Tax=Marinobacter iranensis TaxID=2962607 RepID=A0ABT5YBI0_9GAMM|nr:hypothetical protein [Marinobacter iranensis]MDF0751014.1 hypothetical protein [Marinobacter iranensis]